MSTNSHLPIDQSVVVPDAVRAAGAAADALLAAQHTAPPPPQGGPPPQAGLETVVIPQGGPPPPAGFTQSGNPAPAPPPAPPPQPNGDPPSATPGTVDAQWERRARSWRGQIDAERAAHSREIAGLRGQVDDLVQQINARAAAPGYSGGPAAAAAPIDVSKMISPEMRAKYVEQWGEEMTDAMLGMAAQVASVAVGQVSQQVTAEVTATRQDILARDNAAMMATLDQMLPGGNGQPDWRVVNDEPEFISWLQEADGFSNLTKLQVLQAAWKRNDTQAVHRIFAAYMGQPPLQGGGAGPGQTPPAAPQQGGAPQPSSRLPLHTLAAPGPARASSSGQNGAQDPNMYTTGQIAKFFVDKGRGLYNDTPQRQQWAAGIEVDIFAAQKEGRVVAGP